MNILYSIGIQLASLFIKAIALFNPKLKQGVFGRSQTFESLKKNIKNNDKTFWFHCASLGEYEQGLPVFEALKTEYPNHKVVLSFFSPSGYEVRKNTQLADVVVYLPLDTKVNAKRFLDLVHPDYIIFVKYDIWPNILLEVKKRDLKAILISAVFRKDQRFFKWYGGFMRSSLFAFEHIFTQNESSKSLLESINYNAVSVSGDTRFDRVSNQLKADNRIDFIEEFIDDELCIVFGSTWPEDDALFLDFINSNSDKDYKFIIAPHNVNSKYISAIIAQLNSNVVTFSDKTGKDLSKFNVFILDTIGYLSKVYSYAEIAYVGGAAGKTGLHNVLEPAVFGIPILIGKNYDKFPEAKALIQLNGITSIINSVDFNREITELLHNAELRHKQGNINRKYVESQKGVVIQILNYIRI
ncbi:3-deoxy-D-manno-octulosonic acid transferase [Winogradskyella ursingii]|uniref:3-deoxy-D-manno-octulosonic acid transferase n=1 Tax=Winogradskyella ursingii TaxID=2686079 RepID=UPI0015C7ED9D|nr:glycosyltransferase N-terminal domain-containing protein [Winogradskyella ursingii]